MPKKKTEAVAKDECPDSSDGKHTFSPDVEHDATGRTINCEHCGKDAPASLRNKIIRQLYR